MRGLFLEGGHWIRVLAWPGQTATRATLSLAAEDRRICVPRPACSVCIPVSLSPPVTWLGGAVFPKAPAATATSSLMRGALPVPKGPSNSVFMADTCARIAQAAHVAVSALMPRSTLRTVRFTLNEKKKKRVFFFSSARKKMQWGFCQSPAPWGLRPWGLDCQAQGTGLWAPGRQVAGAALGWGTGCRHPRQASVYPDHSVPRLCDTEAPEGARWPCLLGPEQVMVPIHVGSPASLSQGSWALLSAGFSGPLGWGRTARWGLERLAGQGSGPPGCL